MDGFHAGNFKFQTLNSKEETRHVPDLDPMLSKDIVQDYRKVSAQRPSIMKASAMARAGVFTAFVVLVWLPGVAFAQKKPERVEVNGIAAKVGAHVITKNEVAITLVPIRAKLEERFPVGGAEFEKLLDDARKDVLKELIDRRVLIDQFNQPEIQIAPEAIQKEMQREIRESYQGDANKLRAALKVNRMTVDGYRSLLRDNLIAEEIELRRNEDK